MQITGFVIGAKVRKLIYGNAALANAAAINLLY
jgi:hypothetical protein